MLPVPFRAIPYTRRHEAILAKAKPEWALDPTLKRLTDTAMFGELRQGRDIRFIKKRAGKKCHFQNSFNSEDGRLFPPKARGSIR